VAFELHPEPLSALRWLLNAFDFTHSVGLMEAKRIIVAAYERHQAHWGRGQHDSVGGSCGRG